MPAGSGPSRSRLSTYGLPSAIAALTLMVAAAGVLAAPLSPDSAVAAVFPPWWQREQSAAAVASAGGLIIREGINGTILVVRPTGPRLAERLREHGAILIVNPIAASGCLTAPILPQAPRALS
ncbi:hypothetical protein [Thalassobaculum sp.]|uniref:hypothetical protein n=1 Tax=Thalassobaculum sp. TaxID=2022740 RepID=UPI0032EF8755